MSRWKFFKQREKIYKVRNLSTLSSTEGLVTQKQIILLSNAGYVYPAHHCFSHNRAKYTQPYAQTIIFCSKTKQLQSI